MPQINIINYPVLGLKDFLKSFNSKKQKIYSNQNQIIKTGSASHAINIALEKSIENGYKKIFAPGYNCEVVFLKLNRFKKKINIKYYDVKKDLTPENNVFNKLDSESIFYLVNWNISPKKLEKIRNKCKSKGSIIIEDNALCFPKEKQKEIGDFVIYSIRKFFPVIAGGILAIKNKKFVLSKKEIKKRKKMNIILTAFEELLFFFENILSSAFINSFLYNIFYAPIDLAHRAKQFVIKFNDTGTFQVPFDNSLCNYWLEKKEQILRKRIENYEKYQKAFKGRKYLKHDLKHTNPFGFVLFTEKNNKKIAKKLSKKGYKAGIMWELPQKFKTMKNAWKISQQHIVLPIHHQLSQKQMEKIIRIVREFK